MAALLDEVSLLFSDQTQAWLTAYSQLKFHQFCSSLAQYGSGEILNIGVNQAYYACLVLQDGPPTNHLTN